MGTNTLAALTALAEKLGTTAQFLWATLLKQAYVSVATDLVWCVLLGVAFTLWFRLVRTKTAKVDYKVKEWEDEGAFFAWVGVFILGAMLTCTVAFTISNAVTVAFNPDFWALRRVLSAIN